MVFDHQTGSYLSNVVVFTSLTAVTSGGEAGLIGRTA